MIDEIIKAFANGVKIVKKMGKQAKEAHTENYIINPIFDILGWSAIEERCLPRYSIKGHKGTDEVDFALFADGFSNPPIILVEAKPLGTPFSDKIRGQLEYYGTVAKKAKWLIFTDGKVWIVISNDKKEIVLKFDLDKEIDERFTYISFESVKSGKLQDYTFRSMAEKAVEKYIDECQNILAENIYQHFNRNYPKEEIQKAIKRLKINILNPPPPEPNGKFPIEIYADYKGKRYEAKLLEDGKVIYNGKEYSSVSAAAISIVDSKTRNGWTFWKLVESDQKINTIISEVKPSKATSGESILDRLNQKQLKLIEILKKKANEIDPQTKTWAVKHYFAIGLKFKSGAYPWPIMFAAFHYRKDALRAELRYPFEKLVKPSHLLQLPPNPKAYTGWKGEITVAHINTIEDLDAIFPALKEAYALLKSRYD